MDAERLHLINELHGVAAVLADNECLREQLDGMTAELRACRECASHFKWVIKQQRRQLQRLSMPQ